jgi:hypothetical protein
MLAVLPDRAAQTTTLLPMLTGSLWAWKELGIVGGLIALSLIAVTLALALYVALAGKAGSRRPIAQLDSQPRIIRVEFYHCAPDAPGMKTNHCQFAYWEDCRDMSSLEQMMLDGFVDARWHN